ncbi:phage gp6-like head-tail connector protein [Sphingomonadaceae bacterium G21617-S1]|nr:phage gp6-like head-tail connector protein [Sphingomonadaceae bacterium G21617-S1]
MPDLISLADIKAALRRTSTSEDSRISGLIPQAVSIAQRVMGRSIADAMDATEIDDPEGAMKSALLMISINLYLHPETGGLTDPVRDLLGSFSTVSFG